MTTPSPGRGYRTVKGRDLPVLTRRHGDRRRPLPARIHPPSNYYGNNKPSGGVWAAPVVQPPGRWRPIPRQSTWTQYLDELYEGTADLGYHTRLLPAPDAEFALIDSAADAAALYAAFPDKNNPITQLLALGGLTDTVLARPIDWEALAASGAAGVYLTERGQRATRLPEDRQQVPSLYGWDVASVWFARPAFRLGATRPVSSIRRDGWDGVTAQGIIEAIRADEYPRLRQKGAEGLKAIEAVEEMARALGMPPHA